MYLNYHIYIPEHSHRRTKNRTYDNSYTSDCKVHVVEKA